MTYSLRDDRLLSDEDLENRAIRFTRDHRRKLIKEGKFPKPVKLGGGIKARNAWLESEITRWLAKRLAERA